METPMGRIRNVLIYNMLWLGGRDSNSEVSIPRNC
jgi:hypothetical protein